jgi:hypothetical protein
MQIRSPQCIAALHTLKADEEEVVRAEATSALTVLQDK